jgi:cytochrome c
MILPFHGTNIDFPNLSEDDAKKIAQLISEGRREESGALLEKLVAKTMTSEVITQMKAVVDAEEKRRIIPVD